MSIVRIRRRPARQLINPVGLNPSHFLYRNTVLVYAATPRGGRFFRPGAGRGGLEPTISGSPAFQATDPTVGLGSYYFGASGSDRHRDPNGSFAITTAVTLAGWMFVKNWGVSRPVLRQGVGYLDFGTSAGRNNVYLRRSYSGSGLTSWISTGLDGSQDRWYFLVATHDGTANGSAGKLYVDGVELSQTPPSPSGTVNTSSNPVDIGNRESLNLPFLGNIAWVGYYDRVISPAEVLALYRPQSRWSMFLTDAA